MKQFYKFYKYILTLLAILMATTNAWAGNAKVNAKADPSEGGFVYVATSAGTYTPSKSSDDEEQEGDFWSKKDKTFYLYYKETNNYHFKGWYKVSYSRGQWDACNVNSSSLNGQGQSITQQAGTGFTTADYYYYAIFATLHNTTTPSFNTIDMGNSTTSSISLKHAHANNVTLQITGTNASDFSIGTSSFYSNQLGTKTITITFKPTCAGNRTANLKITNDNGLPEINIPLTAIANSLPQTITWDSPYDLNMFVGGSLNVSATASSHQTVTYSSSNSDIISVNGNTLTAHAEGTATITATQHDGCLYQTVSTSLTFTVSDKKTPTFWLNGDPDQLTDNLKTEDTRTINITNVDASMTATYDPNLLQYTFDGNTATIKALDAGTATLKLTQPETNQIFFGERTFTFNITKYDTNTLTNDLATEYMVDDVVAEADIYTINNTEVPVEIISGNTNILKFENGQLKAVGAGTTTLTIKQSATKKWVERTATKTITVHKFDITADINPSSAYWNELITNPFTASTEHKFSGAISAVADFTVTQQNNEHIALLNNSNYNIQTYYTNGEVNFLITRPEDYKYNALSQTLTLNVANDDNGCNVLNPCNGSFECSLVWQQRDFTPAAFTGIPDQLIFNAKSTNSARVGDIEVQQKVNGAWQNIASINPGTSFSTYTYDLDSTATQIRFYNGYGSYTREFQNVRVTRKTHLRSSDSTVVLSTTSLGTPESKTFTLSWSTCADEIMLTNSNPRFSLNTYRISPTDNQGSTTITVTCDAEAVGNPLRDTIVVYDQTQRFFIPVECVVNDKFIASIKGTTAYSKMVDDTWVADFRFDTCQTALPSADITAPFYYTINHDLTGNDVQKPGYKDQVITYNPESDSITAHNAGTAVLTFIQKPTATHYTDTFRCTITISKHDVERVWKDPVYFNDTIIPYFTTTNTQSPIVIESQTDTDVAKLTNEFNPTSNNSLDLITYNKEASTTVTVSQAETYYWNAYSEDHTITPIDPNNHVTFTIDNSTKMWDVFRYSTQGGIGWDNGIQISDGGFNWKDKFIIIHFTGVPDTLFFSTNTQTGATGVKFSVSEGSTPNALTEIYSKEETENAVKIKLNPNTRYLKLCYSGNLNGYFRGTDKYSGVTVTELNQFKALPDTLNFGLQYVDNPDTTQTFDFHYANAGYKVQLQSTDPHFSLSTTHIDTIGGEKHGIVKDIQVTYRPTETHNTADTDAKILIWDEAGHKDTVFLVANTIKSTPTLYWTQAWSATEPIVLLDQTVTNAAASTNGYTSIKYRSSDNAIIQIINDGTAFLGIAPGRALITAYQEPDRVYNAPEKEISKTFIVTDKIAQYIVWEDNLTNLRTGDAPVTLTAQVWVMTDAATNTWEYSPEQTAELQYSSPNDSIVSVSGNTLTINGVGELMLEVFIPADDTYEYAHAQVPVRVRDYSSTCTDEDLIIPVKQNGNLLDLADKLEYDPYAITGNEEHIVEIDRTQGIPGELIFAYYGREAWWQLSGRIRVYESTDGGNTYQQILSDADAVTPQNQNLQYSPHIPLSRNATHIKFQRFESIKLGYHIIQYITVYPAKYIEAEDVYMGNIYLGNTVDTTITFQFSSVRSDMELTTSSNTLSVSPNTIRKECGEWGEEQLTITLYAAIAGEFHQQVYIHDKNGNISETIHVYATIVKNTPTITWNTTDTIRSSAEWETKKTAIASSGDQVLYELTAGNQPDEYAYLNNNGKMILLRGGWITARAYTAATTTSNEASAEHNFFIIVDPLFEDFDNDSTWNNDNNWNIGRTPWATDSATIQANKHIQLSTEVSINGLQFEAGSSIHITATGGLSVGAQGIQGATTDGSSLILDNLKTGIGFLRISPDYKGAMPRTTVRYQTRSTLDTGANNDATWQYIGAPGANCQFTVDYITWLYQWSEPHNWLNKTGTLTLEPFAGYAITQYGEPTYDLIAEPINTDRTITLTKTENGMNGNNLFANSYMAPIDAKNFTPEDFSDYNTGREDIVKTFYIFNSGSWNQWNKYNTEQSKGSNGNDTPGQYCAVPAFSSQYMDGAEITTLPPMQGIYVIANTDGAQIHLNYDKHVWKAGTNNKVSTDMHEPMRAPHRIHAQQQMQQDTFRRIRIQLNSANSGADRLYIIQSEETTPEYDNGYDAPNQTVEGLTNIYTTESFGKMEVSCSNHIDSMYIGFQAGPDTQYTLSFSSLIGDMLYLEDLEQDTIVAMQQGMPYTFRATAHSINDHRFRLLVQPKDNTPTDTDQVNNIHLWMNDNMLHITGAPANSAMHIYNISGAHILTQAITNMPHTYDLSHLPAGVYVIRINNYTYKVITQ